MGTMFQSAASGRMDRCRARGAAIGRIGAMIGVVQRATTRAAGAFLRARRQRATIEELRRLDDRTLSDIGLTRDMIGAAVGQLYDHRPAEKEIANENEPPMAA